jgi:hypothetical protein
MHDFGLECPTTLQLEIGGMFPTISSAPGGDGTAEQTKTARTSPRKQTLRLVLLSDTHALHPEVEVSDGDILIHAGDFTLFSYFPLDEVADFNSWLGELPHRHKIVVPDSHEYFLETDPSGRSLLSNAIVLIDEGIEIYGLRIWGTPV